MHNVQPLNIARRLIDAGIPSIIIGGHAVNFHGYPRSTQDVDIIYQRTPDSMSALHEVLTELDAYWISDEIDSSTGIEKVMPVTVDYIQREHMMMLGTKLGYVDLFDFIPGMPTQPLADIFSSASSSGSLKFANLYWLRRMKVSAGRPQDLIDLANLPDA